mgnify:CR=1 FL=1
MGQNMFKLKSVFLIVKVFGYDLFIITFMVVVKLLLVFGLNNAVKNSYNILLSLWPEKKGDLLVRFGWAYERNGKLDEAMNYFQKASEIEPENAIYHFELATLLEKKGELEQAIERYRQVLSHGSDLANGFISQITIKIEELNKK